MVDKDKKAIDFIIGYISTVGGIFGWIMLAMLIHYTATICVALVMGLLILGANTYLISTRK